LLRGRTSEAAGLQWLTPVILATQEAEIRRIVVGSQPKANQPEGNSSTTTTKP
jgi:hypothetical protein